MSVTDKELILYFRQKTTVPHNEERISKTISEAKKAYYMAESENPLSRIEFLYYQSKYIRKYWWFLQGFLLVGAWLFLKYSESSYYIQRSIGSVAPLFVILIMPEIWKNKNINAMEIEGTTYYSLRQIYSARFVLFALVDVILLSLFFAAASFTEKIMINELIVQFFVPFNVTCCICFSMLYSRKVMSEAFALLSCMIWAVIWGQIVLNDTIYQFISVPSWIAMLVLSALYLIYVIQKGQKKCREIWEVNTLWN